MKLSFKPLPIILGCILLFILCGHVLPSLPTSVKKVFSVITDCGVLGSFTFVVLYAIFNMKDYTKLYKTILITDLVCYGIMYVSYMLGYEAKYQYISGIGFDLCTIILTCLACLSEKFKVKRKR